MTIFSANSVSREAGTLWNVKSTRRSSSVAKTASFFFMETTSLRALAQIIKKTSVPTTLQRSGESRVKVKKPTSSNIC
jgi:hypothetical protein